MRRNFALYLTVISIMISLIGCSAQPKPEVTIKEYLDVFKTGVAIDNNKYFNGSITAFDGLMTPDNTSPAEVVKAMKDIVYGFEYVVNGTTIAKDKTSAIVNVEITTVDGSSLLSNFMSQFFMNGLAMSFAGKTQVEIEKYAVELFADLSSKLEKNRIFKVDVKLIKVDKKWLMTSGEANFALFDAMSGGMLSAGKNLENSTS